MIDAPAEITPKLRKEAIKNMEYSLKYAAVGVVTSFFPNPLPPRYIEARSFQELTSKMEEAVKDICYSPLGSGQNRCETATGVTNPEPWAEEFVFPEISWSINRFEEVGVFYNPKSEGKKL